MDIQVNGKQRRVEEGLTISGLLEQLQLSGQPVAVELNFDLLPAALHESTPLKERDQIEVVTLAGGG